MSTKEILKDIRSFVGSPGSDGDDKIVGEFQLDPQDITVIRQNVTAGMKFDKVRT